LRDNLSLAGRSEFWNLDEVIQYILQIHIIKRWFHPLNIQNAMKLISFTNTLLKTLLKSSMTYVDSQHKEHLAISFIFCITYYIMSIDIFLNCTAYNNELHIFYYNLWIVFYTNILHIFYNNWYLIFYNNQFLYIFNCMYRTYSSKQHPANLFIYFLNYILNNINWHIIITVQPITIYEYNFIQFYCISS
jgi:hypothetical protein